MTDNSQHNSPRLTDEHMDQLLTAFYTSEVPEQLQQPPSSWPELQVPAADMQPLAVASGSVTSVQSETRTQVPTARRGIAVAAATLAACLMVMLFSQSPSQPEYNDPTITKTAPEVDPADATFNVSSQDGDTKPLGDSQPTLEELDNIDLTPKKLLK